jgi:glycosyltransferase involved in cell wall biosynthesis
MSYPRISIVTPNFNQGEFIEQTINSVLSQNYPNLEYIIIDGGSTDQSLEIIKKYNDKISYWISEKDMGMYDAINKGFAKSTGSIMAWINSDDILAKDSLANVAAIFLNDSTINWLQGFPTVIDEANNIIYQRKPVYTKWFFYSKRYHKSLNFIQQESTFWTRQLWESAGGKIDCTYKLAADFDLWMRFFKYKKLVCTNLQLGAFRKRKGQQSENIENYLTEASQSVQLNYEGLKWNQKIIINLGIFLYRVFKINH